ncbi:MAG TPA: DUF2840 domain-containing protein [Acetobacteraceae bacterium]|nr:DUF2840 domain-containing protein [Acetobacteraceae bacterium]
MSTQEPLTSVTLVFLRDRVEHWLRFGRDAGERILDRRRRQIFFAPGAVFAFIRWQANDYGTVISRADILRACGTTEPYATVPGVNPGGENLLRLSGWQRVARVLTVIDAVEQTGIEAADVAPAYWRHVHNRLLCGEQSRPYGRDQHRAWLQRRGMMAS